jgi:hypothetical protein
MNLKDKDMTPLEEMLTTEIIMSNERINDLEYVLGQLKSQLLDTHAEDSLLINIITQALKK